MSEQKQQMQVKHITNINDLESLEAFIEALEREFSLTNFSFVKETLKSGAFYSFNTQIEYEEEGSYKALSKQTISFSGYSSWGGVQSNDPTTTQRKFNWMWITSSDHLLMIDMEFYREGQGEPFQIEGSVYIGTDESKGFYPAIRSIIKDLGFPIF